NSERPAANDRAPQFVIPNARARNRIRPRRHIPRRGWFGFRQIAGRRDRAAESRRLPATHHRPARKYRWRAWISPPDELSLPRQETHRLQPHSPTTTHRLSKRKPDENRSDPLNQGVAVPHGASLHASAEGQVNGSRHRRPRCTAVSRTNSRNYERIH